MYNSPPALKNKRTFVYNPEHFAEQHLPPQLRHFADWAKLLLDIIERRHLALDEISNAYVCLHSKVLEKQIDPHVYYPIRNALEDAGIIEVNHSYANGYHSKGYRLAEPYASMKRARVMLTNNAVIKKVAKNKSKYQVVVKTPEHERLYHWLQQVEMDHKSAHAWIDQHSFNKPIQRRRCELDVMRLTDKDYYFKTDISGRVHNNVVNLKRELRHYLTINNEKLVNIDISNSQPLFLSLHLLQELLLKQNVSVSVSDIHNVLEKRTRGLDYKRLYGLPNDMQAYIKLTEQGRLYNYLGHEAQTNYTPKVFKRKVFGQVFFNQRTTKPARIRDAFKRLFPSVYKHIDELKHHDYKNAAYTLQRKEADFIINTVCRRLFTELPEVPILTIHDSILTTSKHAPQVYALMMAEFHKQNLNPTIKTTEY